MAVNRAPSLVKAIKDVVILEGAAWKLKLASETFQDLDGDALVYTAKLASGDALPSWLRFNADTQTFVGTPPEGFAGALDIQVTASDGNLAASDTFKLTVEAVNDAPTVAQPIPNQAVSEQKLWTFVVPAGTFTDVDSPQLSYTASLGSGVALPSWLSFDPGTRTFSGTPPIDFAGTLDLRVTASDGSLTVSDGFRLTVRNVNDPVVLITPLADRSAEAGIEWNWVLPDGAFRDVDVDNALTFRARLASGELLPSWLTFDSRARTLTGTPPTSAIGTLDIKITASDGSTTASDVFRITVVAHDRAPTVANPIVNKTIAEDQAWTFTIPADTFKDTDTNSALTYRASLANNIALPAWLAFDPATGTFNGTPPADWNGFLDIVVTADDGAKTVSDSFRLTVTPVDDAPRRVKPLPDDVIQEDATWSYKVEANSFVEVDGQKLTYTATRANGTALPDWVQFDAKTLTFSGAPPEDFNGALDIKLTASDGTRTTADNFRLTVEAVNDAPVVARPIDDKVVDPGVAWTFKLAGGTFDDPDSTLTYSAKLADGKALPSWLHFDGTTQTFSGTPPASFGGTMQIAVSASDGQASATETFWISDGAPILEHRIEDQGVNPGVMWTFKVPADTFEDPNSSRLTYKATLSDGTALPSWLTFDARDMEFRGVPPADFTDPISLKVTASDGTHTVSDVFKIYDGPQIKLHGSGDFAGYKFTYDDLFVGTSGNTSLFSYEDSFDSSPGPYGGMSVAAGFGYDLGAGLKFGFEHQASQYDFDYGMDIIEVTSPVTDVLNGSPWIMPLAVQDGDVLMESTGGTTSLDAYLGAFLKANLYGHLNLWGGVDFLFDDAGFDIGGPFDIPLVDVGINLIDVHLKSGDDIVKLADDYEGIAGFLNIGVPDVIDTQGDSLGDGGVGGLRPLTSSGSERFLEAGLDLASTLANLLGIPSEVFSGEFSLEDLNGGQGLGFDIPYIASIGVDAGLKYTTFALNLVGSASLKESYTFTPDVDVSMTSEFGDTVTGKLGDKFAFDGTKAGEGEGRFNVMATYQLHGVVRAELAISLALGFEYTFLSIAGFAEAHASFLGAGVNYRYESPTYTLLEGTLGDVSIDIPFYTETDRYEFGTATQEFSVAYENFRTVLGSGDNFTVTTHQIRAVGNDRANALVGNTLDNIIVGLGGEDHLQGLDGNDRLDGGDGDDKLLGGAGNDLLKGGAGKDTFVGGGGDDEIHGGADADTIKILGGNSQVFGDSGRDIITASVGTGSNFIDGGTDDDVIDASGANNTIRGGAGVDRITADGGDSTIYGDAGNDLITAVAGAGSNVVDGGADNDVIDVTGASNEIHGGAGVDRVTAGGGSSTIYGDAGNDIITTAAGTGSNFVDGGDDDDVIKATGASNEIHGGAGVDRVTSSDGNSTIYGDEGNDIITAATAKVKNFVDGGDGNDVINTRGASNEVHGGAGGDRITVSDGTSKVYGDAGNDVITLVKGRNFIAGGEGDDVIVAGGAGSEIDGGGGADRITGDDGVDAISGGAGRDIIIAGKGDETIYGDGAAFLQDVNYLANGPATPDYGDLFIFGLGSGRDFIGDFNQRQSFGLVTEDRIDVSAYIAIENVDDFHLTKKTQADGYTVYWTLRLSDTDSITFHPYLEGSAFSPFAADTFIFAKPSVDRVVGTAGNDTLDGGALADTLIGKTGNDTYIVDSVGEIIVEAAGQGSDTALVECDYTLAAGVSVETIKVGKGTGHDITGNEFAQTITGDSGRNILSGAGGNDVLNGGLDNDVLKGGDGDDRLFGGDGIDTLDGGAGDDILDGGLGEGGTQFEGGNRFVGGAGFDTIRYALTDSMFFYQDDSSLNIGVAKNDSFSSIERIEFSDAALGDSVYGGTGADNYFGRGGNDRLAGRGGNDRLEGGDGNDLLNGGVGNNILVGGAGADTFLFTNQMGFGDPNDPKNPTGANDMVSVGSINTIADFHQGEDVISCLNLRSLGNVNFGWANAFSTGGRITEGDALATGMAGWFRDGSNVNIVFNADLDAAIEYTIVLKNTTSLTINGTGLGDL